MSLANRRVDSRMLRGNRGSADDWRHGEASKPISGDVRLMMVAVFLVVGRNPRVQGTVKAKANDDYP